MFPFYTPENTRKPKVFWCFQGVQNGNIGQKRVNITAKYLILIYKNLNLRKSTFLFECFHHTVQSVFIFVCIQPLKYKKTLYPNQPATSINLFMNFFLIKTSTSRCFLKNIFNHLCMNICPIQDLGDRKGQLRISWIEFITFCTLWVNITVNEISGFLTWIESILQMTTFYTPTGFNKSSRQK